MDTDGHGWGGKIWTATKCEFVLIREIRVNKDATCARLEKSPDETRISRIDTNSEAVSVFIRVHPWLKKVLLFCLRSSKRSFAADLIQFYRG
jgi:hypothetical protein